MSTVSKIDVFPLRLPIKKLFTFASGSAGKVKEGAPHVLVKVTDSDGVVGWGEGRPVPGWSCETLETVTTTLRNYLAPAVLGLQRDDRWKLHQTFHRVLGRGPSDGQPIARAALDMAIHDAAAKASGKTLRAYLGGGDDRCTLPLSFTMLAHNAAQAREEMAEAQAAGFLHYNFKAGWSPQQDIAVAEVARELGGADAFVWADANQGLKPATMRATANGLLQAGANVLEQPVAADQFRLMQALRASTSIPLAVDEASVGPSDFLRHVEAGLVDYLVVKVTRSGGLWPSAQQLAIAQAAGLDFLVSGLTDGLLTKLAAAQLAAAYGYAGPLALNGSQFTDEEALFPQKAELESQGHLHLNDQPGLGATPDETALSSYLVTL